MRNSETVLESLNFELTQMESRIHREVHVRFGGEYAKTCLQVRRCVLSLRIPVFNILEKTCFVTLAHPKYTKPQVPFVDIMWKLIPLS